MQIGIVTGEMSGDILGADLMRALRQRFPTASFSGIGGPRMLAGGFQSLFPQDRLAVMGLVEPLKRLPELLRIRAALRRHFIEQRFDLVIGIDSPDFNLDLELKLHEAGIRTAHYVSPSVWAWRRGRVHKIARAVDMMLTLFPFEAAFYEQHGVPVHCVGHPLADEIEPGDHRPAARGRLGLAADRRVVTLMPGSRAGEVGLLLPDFLAAAGRLLQEQPDLVFLIPAANPARREQIDAAVAALANPLPVTVLDGQSHDAMAAADAILMASGTATLEGMLLGRPMVVAYRMHWLSYAILSRIVKTDYFALPNLLAGRELVPELAQRQVTPAALAAHLSRALQDADYRDALQAEFSRIHHSLRRGAGNAGAAALAPLLARAGERAP